MNVPATRSMGPAGGAGVTCSAGSTADSLVGVVTGAAEGVPVATVDGIASLTRTSMNSSQGWNTRAATTAADTASPAPIPQSQRALVDSFVLLIRSPPTTRTYGRPLEPARRSDYE